MTQWWYKQDGQQIGPFTVQELRQFAEGGVITPETLLVHPDGQEVVAVQLNDIWNSGSADAPALPVPPLIPAIPLPPPVPSAQQRSEIVNSAALSQNAEGRATTKNSQSNVMEVGLRQITEVGLSQKWLLWAVLASVVGWFYPPIPLLLAIPLQLYSVFRLTRALAMPTSYTALYLIAMFLPGVSLICLLILNGKATTLLEEHGIHVGLMGAKLSNLPLVSAEAAESKLSPAVPSSKTSSRGDSRAPEAEIPRAAESEEESMVDNELPSTDRSFMRNLIAGCFLGAALGVGKSFATRYPPPPFWTSILGVAVIAGFVALAYQIVNRSWKDMFGLIVVLGVVVLLREKVISIPLIDPREYFK